MANIYKILPISCIDRINIIRDSIPNIIVTKIIRKKAIVEND